MLINFYVALGSEEYIFNILLVQIINICILHA